MAGDSSFSRRFKDDDDEKKRSHQPSARFAHEQSWPGAGLGHGQNFPCPVKDHIFFGVNHVVHAKKLETSIHQKHAQNVENPFKSLDENCTGADHYAAHDERTQHAPEQQAMLVTGIDSKILEDQNEDEYVIHAERFFDYVPCKKIYALAPPVE